MSSDAVRYEHDLLGDRAVPGSAYYGVHTLRALENFPITGTAISIYPELVSALACVKLAAALANNELGLLDDERAQAIARACREIRDGGLLEHFVVDVIQGGAGTSTNMNANEVIANRALELMGRAKGDYAFLHPLDHVNMSQSTNDVYPTAVKVALHFGIQRLTAAMAELRGAFAAKAAEFADVLKMGRTQLQEAVPMTLGQEFSTYAVMLEEDEQRLREAVLLIHEINLGATAIGTGITAHPGYAPLACRKLADITGIALVTAPNLVEATQDAGAFVQLSGVLKRVAVKLSKTCNDLRLLSSGPRGGIERDQPAGGAGGLLDHAGQGEPGHSGSGQPDRVRGDRQRRDRIVRRRSGAAPVERLRAHHRAQPVQEHHAPPEWLRHSARTLRHGHHGQPRALAAYRGELDRHRDGLESVHRLCERDAARAGSARDGEEHLRAGAGEGPAQPGAAGRDPAARGADAAALRAAVKAGMRAEG